MTPCDRELGSKRDDGMNAREARLKVRVREENTIEHNTMTPETKNDEAEPLDWRQTTEAPDSITLVSICQPWRSESRSS